MQLLRHNHHTIPLSTKPCVATIGNFDGVHLGHQAIIKKLLSDAQQRQLPSVIICFEPQPQEYFRPQQAPIRLTRFREKFERLQSLQADYLCLLKFNQRLANLTAEEFIQQILVKQLQIKHLLIGDDFRFGKGRTGNFELLQQQGQQFGFSVENLPTYEIKQQRVSSTRVRQLLSQGDLARAKQLLGHHYRISGKVSYGRQLGRKLGYPTVNIPLFRHQSPLHGIFITQITNLNPTPIYGVANIGNNPTVTGNKQFVLEIYLFDYDQELYGQYLQVDILTKIRDEAKFESLELLKQAIEWDVVVAREYINSLEIRARHPH